MLLPVRFFVVAALAVEVTATVLVAVQIGVLWTFLWFFASFVLGIFVMRMAGMQAFAALRGATSQADVTRAGTVAGDSVLLFLAGVLLAVPGVLTDALGLLLLVPPLRTLIRKWIARSAGRRFPNVRSTFTTVRLADGSVVIPGEVVDDVPGESDPSRDDDDPPRRELL